ncbi:hypothetical protein D7X96_36445, partial [Corallococcus interemptor]
GATTKPTTPGSASKPNTPDLPGSVSKPNTPGLPGGANSPASKLDKLSNPLSALKQDGFDMGGIGGKAAELGKLLEGAANVLSSIAQLVQGITQGVQGVADGVAGAAGAVGGAVGAVGGAVGAVGGAAGNVLSLVQGQGLPQDPTAGMAQAPTLE